VLRLLADENIKTRLIRGVLRKNPDIDIVRVQDVGLASAADEVILEWAAGEGRLVITYDVTTMPDAAYRRVVEGLSMPGVFALPWSASLRQIIDDLVLLAEASQPDEWEGQIIYLPL
jgi:Domain of unknown function (DUF5615)